MTVLRGRSGTSSAELRCTVDDTYLERVDELLERLWESAAIGDVDKIHFTIAALELAGNLLQHGVFDSPVVRSDHRPVLAEWTVVADEQEIRASCRDTARPVDGAELLGTTDPSRMLDDLASEHGRGLALALRSVDEVSYRRLSDPLGWSNEWTIVRRRTA